MSLGLPLAPPPPSGGFRRSDSTAEFRRALAPHVFALGRFLWLGVLTAVFIIPVGREGGTPDKEMKELIIMLGDLKIPQDFRPNQNYQTTFAVAH